MYFRKNMVDDAIPNREMASHVNTLIDELDYDRELVVVLVFEDESSAMAIRLEKLEPIMDQSWFEMQSIRRNLFSKSVWIPLRATQKLRLVGQHGRDGFQEEFFGAMSVMFPTDDHELAGELAWSDLNLSTGFQGYVETDEIEPGPEAASKRIYGIAIPFGNTYLSLNRHRMVRDPIEVRRYYTSGTYRDHRSGRDGVMLVIPQEMNSNDPVVWHLDQDFVTGLGLLREEDTWVRPSEGYLTVARLRRDERDNPNLLEVRCDHLRDYLCARGMNLYLVTYRSRSEICSDSGHIGWEQSPVVKVTDDARWEGRINDIHEGGMAFGSTSAHLRISYKNLDGSDDVPELGFPSDENTEIESSNRRSTGRRLFRISGELWKNEVIFAGESSERVLGERPESGVEFIIDAAGNRRTGQQLIRARSWLWFDPSGIRSILNRRGASLRWYTRETGEICLIPDAGVHFGINKLGFINVYAKDIGELAIWQQRLWAGFNVGPDGGVSSELLDSQKRAEPADSLAPESQLRNVYESANEAFLGLTGDPLFRQHQIIDQLFRRSHRFRAVDRSSLFELAKDLCRLTVESLNVGALRSLNAPPEGRDVGSIKQLQYAMETIIGVDEARAITASLAGLNELRQADAHLPSSELDHSMNLAGIIEPGIPIMEARQILEALVDTLRRIEAVFRD